jgi:hypothetical protein
MFKYDGRYFTNIKNGKKITVSGGKDAEAQPVWVWNKYNGNHPAQIWKVVYTHKMGDEAYIKKGKKDKYTGFIVDEPFYFRSKLPMQRVVECVGASNAVLKKWYKNRKAQEWRFDPVSKTIRNRNWTSYALSMEGNNLRCRSQNSRWF